MRLIGTGISSGGTQKTRMPLDPPEENRGTASGSKRSYLLSRRMGLGVAGSCPRDATDVDIMLSYWILLASD